MVEYGLLDLIEKKMQEAEALKNTIKGKISMIQLRKRTRLRSRHLAADPTRRKFWRFLKAQFKRAGQLTAVKSPTGQMLFEEEEIEDVIIDHFTKIFSASPIPVNSEISDADAVNSCLLEIDQMLGEGEEGIQPDKFEEVVCAPYTYSEVEDILAKLPNNRASGYDRINNELLKYSGPKFRQFLHIFLNRILEEGCIPDSMNTGKCMLIHKVRKL